MHMLDILCVLCFGSYFNHTLVIYNIVRDHKIPNIGLV